MRQFRIVICIMAAALLAACSTPEERAAKSQERAYKAQEDVSRQRLKLVEQYQKCVKDASGDALKVEACDTYLRSAEALK